MVTMFSYQFYLIYFPPPARRDGDVLVIILGEIHSEKKKISIKKKNNKHKKISEPVQLQCGHIHVYKMKQVQFVFCCFFKFLGFCLSALAHCGQPTIFTVSAHQLAHLKNQIDMTWCMHRVSTPASPTHPLDSITNPMSPSPIHALVLPSPSSSAFALITNTTTPPPLPPHHGCHQ